MGWNAPQRCDGCYTRLPRHNQYAHFKRDCFSDFHRGGQSEAYECGDGQLLRAGGALVRLEPGDTLDARMNEHLVGWIGQSYTWFYGILAVVIALNLLAALVLLISATLRSPKTS